MNSEIDGFFSCLAGFMLLTAIIAAFVFGMILIIPVGIATVVGIILYSRYSPNSKQNLKQSEVRETKQLYNQAKALAPLTEDEFGKFISARFDDHQIQDVAV